MNRRCLSRKEPWRTWWRRYVIYIERRARRLEHTFLESGRPAPTLYWSRRRSSAVVTAAAGRRSGAAPGEGGGSEACDPDVASLRQLLAPSPAPMTVAAVGDAAGEAAGEGGVAGEGDAPLKAAVEGLHARFLLEAFLSAARREMTGLQSRFDEMASEMRACGVYLAAATQPKETKEQLKELVESATK